MKPYFAEKEKFDVFYAELLSWLGTPYWRNEGIKGRGADCSLFIAKALQEVGVLTKIEKPQYLPRDWQTHGEEEIFHNNFKEHAKFLAKGICVCNSDGCYLAGDWMLFSTSIRGLLNHSAIYLGNGEIIHSTEKAGVHIDEFSKWQKHLKTVYRLYNYGT